MKTYFKNKGIKGIIFALIFTIIFSIVFILNGFLKFNNTFMDKYQHPKKSNNIIIVGIDDNTINELGPVENYSEYRKYYAKVIDNLSTKNPSVIGLDILFTGNSGSETNDNLLAEACKDRNVICGMELIFGETFYGDSYTVKTTIKGISYPYDKLNENVESGYVNALLDKEDGVARKTFATMKYNGMTYDSFSYLIYKKYCISQGLKINKYKNNEALRINYHSNPNSNYTVVSFSDVYNGFVPSDIEDSIVLIGAFASGLQDSYYTTINKSKMTYGVEIHANIIDSYLDDDFIYDFNHKLIIFFAIIIILLFSYLIYKSRIIISSISSALLIILLIFLQSILYKNYIYYPFNDLILCLSIIYIFYVIFKYSEELYKRFKTVSIFKRYLEPSVVDKLLKENNYNVNLKGEKKNICCLFVDIRGFTPLSESLEPFEIVEILNEYLTLTSNCIFKCGGTVDKFIGDATMAIYNAPFDLADYKIKAIESAILMRDGAKLLDEDIFNKYNKHVSFGIGINIGDAIVGNIGSDKRLDYTAIGDTVNTAARLESRALANEILISENLYLEVKDRVNCEYYDELSLKGKANKVKTYKVINLKGDNNEILCDTE